MKKKNFQMLSDTWIRNIKINDEVSKSKSNILVRNNFFLENDDTSEGAVSQKCFILSTSLRWSLLVSFYTNKYFEQLPIVSSASLIWLYFLICWKNEHIPFRRGRVTTIFQIIYNLLFLNHDGKVSKSLNVKSQTHYVEH